MITAKDSVIAISERELDDSAGMVEIQAVIICDKQTADKIKLALTLDLHKLGISYVPQSVYKMIIDRAAS